MVKICEESQHTKWICCDISATRTRGGSSDSTPPTNLPSNTLHRPGSIKPSTEASTYFGTDLDEESDIFGDNFHLAEESLDEDASLFDLMGELTGSEEEEEITTLEPDNSTTSTTTLAPTHSTARTSRLPRTTPKTSGAGSIFWAWNVLLLYLGVGLIFW